MEIAGSAALVTGAASGLGAATAATLAAQGASVYGLDLEKAIAAANAPDGVTLMPADVTEEAGVRAALARIDDDEQELRLAVNCAGIAPSARIVSRRGPHDLDLFRTVVGVNLVGTFNVAYAASTGMPDEVRAGLAANVPFPQRSPDPRSTPGVLMIAAHDYLNGETIRMDGALRMGPR